MCRCLCCVACRSSHLYFSEIARDKAARNLSIATCISGVKSAGKRIAITTSKLWDRIYKESKMSPRFNKQVVAQDLQERQYLNYKLNKERVKMNLP